jgi:hypothetical protein
VQALPQRIMKVKPLYNMLGPGELIKEGDEAFTWVDAECTSTGWVRIEGDNPEVGKPWNRGMVKMRRRRERTTSLQR